jgi:hypothetical protein
VVVGGYFWKILWCEVAAFHRYPPGRKQGVFHPEFVVVIGFRELLVFSGFTLPFITFSGDALGFVFAALPCFLPGFPEVAS